MTEREYNNCVEAYSDGVYRFALKSLREEDAARDVVQESFLRLWINRESVLPGKEKSYLFTIAYRLIVDQVRENRRHVPHDIPLHSYGSVSQDENRRDLREIVARFLERLPDPQRNLILLRDYEGYSYRELAEMTAMTEAQVKITLYRARVALKEQIKDLSLLI